MAQCGHQSPVDILRESAEFNANLKGGQFSLDYFAEDCTNIDFNGYTWTVHCDPTGKSFFTASHLPARYKLLQFHAHWADKATNGSEHWVQNNGYAAEIHFVHINSNYSTMEEAAKHKDGLAVIGVFLEESQTANKALQPVIDLLPKTASQQNVKVPITKEHKIDLDCLVPENKEFWTYYGSLTTPPYTECVLWTVMHHPSTISSDQLAQMRALKPGNVREPHPLNDRKITTSFEL